MKAWLSRMTQLLRKRSKKDRILEYLTCGKTITQMQAIKMFNAYRLSDIVFKLKKEGYEITNLNNKGMFAEYKLTGGSK